MLWFCYAIHRILRAASGECSERRTTTVTSPARGRWPRALPSRMQNKEARPYRALKRFSLSVRLPAALTMTHLGCLAEGAAVRDRPPPSAERRFDRQIDRRSGCPLRFFDAPRLTSTNCRARCRTAREQSTEVDHGPVGGPAACGGAPKGCGSRFGPARAVGGRSPVPISEMAGRRGALAGVRLRLPL